MFQERKKTVSTDDDSKVPYDGLGTRNFFSRTLRMVRSLHMLNQSEFFPSLNTSIVSRIENGQQNIPARGSLEELVNNSPINPEDRDRIMVSAGYLPRLPWELDDNDAELLTHALRELMIGDSVRPGSAIELFQFRASQMRKLQSE